MNVNEDNLEFAVSQAVDGVLADHDRHALGGRLLDADARAMAADHQRLTALLRGYGAVPAVDYDALAAAFSSTLARETPYAAAAIPLRPTWTRRLATAAAVAMVAAAAWPFIPHRGRPAPPAEGGRGEAIVQIPSPVLSAGGVAVVHIGPSDAMVQRGFKSGLTAEAPVPAPRVVISSADGTNDVKPY